MKIIDGSNLSDKKNNVGLFDRARSRLGISESKEDPAQKLVISSLEKVLDQQYYLLNNVTLEGPDIPIPIILIGPQGIWVFYASSEKGVFRAREDEWQKLDETTRRYKSVRPNLLTRTQLMARALEANLSERTDIRLSVEPILFFADPGVHVDATRPVARIVLADALNRFLAGLIQSPAIFDQNTIQKVVSTLAGEQSTEAVTQKFSDTQDAFTLMEVPEEKTPKLSPIVTVERNEPQMFKKLPFNNRQWLVLGVIAFIDILVLVLFAIFIIMAS